MVPWQGLVFPVIVLGCAGTVLAVTISVRAVLLPQPLFAVTDIVPPVAPAVVVMDVVVELPLHPAGNVHEYDVAPDTDAML